MGNQTLSVRRRALTLVEILVVVAILLLLTALLLPVLAQARKRSYESVCVNNLRQLGVAWLAYTQDYGEYPPTLLQIQSYVKAKDIYRCRADLQASGANTLFFREAGFPSSYFAIPEDEIDRKYRTLLRERDPNHGLIFCLLHGERLGTAPPPDADWFNPFAHLSGRVLRIGNDGSLKTPQVAVRCFRSSGGSTLRGREMWDLLSDVPCPPEICPIYYDNSEVPCSR